MGFSEEFQKGVCMCRIENNIGLALNQKMPSQPARFLILIAKNGLSTANVNSEARAVAKSAPLHPSVQPAAQYPGHRVAMTEMTNSKCSMLKINETSFSQELSFVD
jgi:hypothetical protein